MASLLRRAARESRRHATAGEIHSSSAAGELDSVLPLLRSCTQKFASTSGNGAASALRQPPRDTKLVLLQRRAFARLTSNTPTHEELRRMVPKEANIATGGANGVAQSAESP